MRLTTADILKLVPEFMRDDEAVKGLAAAVNKLIREPGEMVKTARVWDQIDHLNDQQLDELAYELDIDWYSSSLPLENKRAVVKISDLVHSRRGTKWAVEQLIAAYISPGSVMEWYEEGYDIVHSPRPFHFIITTNHRNVTDTIFREFIAISQVAMSVRSRLDGVYFSDTYGAPVIANTPGVSVHFFTSKKCGTIPRLAVVGKITQDSVIASELAEGYPFDLIEAGELPAGVSPRLAVLGRIHSEGITADETAQSFSFTLPDSGELAAGTFPDAAAIGVILTETAEAGNDAEGFSFTLKKAGTQPRAGTLGAASTRKAGAGASEVSKGFTSIKCGTTTCGN